MSAAADMPHLDPGAESRLRGLLAALAADHRSLSSVRDPQEAWRVHVLDSVAGLEVPALRAARRIADLGAGAGFPGLVLAVALPDARVDLIESVGRKCDFIEQMATELGIANATVIRARSEDWAREVPPAGGREAYDVVCARAVAPLGPLAELACPLLRLGGELVAWKGAPDPEELAAAEVTAPLVGMSIAAPVDVSAMTGYDHRSLHIVRKTAPTPAGFPRRAGMARKRPLA